MSRKGGYRKPGNAKNAKAKDQAEMGNYQDAFADAERVKSSFKSNKIPRKPSNYGKNKSGKFRNHDEWYNKIPQLVQDAASISSATMGGVPFTLLPEADNANVTEQTFEHPRYRLDPGVLTITWYPTIGQSNLDNPATEAVNVAATSLFGYITHANSRNTTYEASDLMMYTMSVSDAYSYLVFMRRLYGRLTPFSAIDRTTPELIMTSLGGDYDDLSVNANDFRGYINIYAQKLGQLALPGGLPYHDRHMWMNESLFTDTNNSMKKQYYAYTQGAYYLYQEKMPGKPGHVQLVYPQHTENGVTGNFVCGDDTTNRATFGVNHKGLTYEEIKDFGNKLINNLLWSEDINKMSADIIKACSNLYKISMIDETYTVPAVYDPEVTAQFENFYAYTPNWGVPMPLMPLGYIEQNVSIGTGYMYDNTAIFAWFRSNSQPIEQTDVNNNLKYQLKEVLINAHQADMPPAFVMKATRAKTMNAQPYSKPIEGAFDLQTVRDNYNDGSLKVPFTGTCSIYTYRSTGSEVTYRMNHWVKTTNGGKTPLVNIGDTLFSTVNIPDAGNLMISRNILESAFNSVMSIQSFDWHPAVNVNILENTASESGEEFFPIPYIGQDLDNFTVIDLKTLNKIHQVALLSEFTFDGLGNYGIR